MKDFKKFNLVLCLLATIFLVNCSKNETDDNLLLGEWTAQAKEGNSQEFVRFNSDGAGLSWSTVDGVTDYQFAFTYKYDKKKQIISMTIGSETSEIKVVKLTESVLEVGSLDSTETKTYSRVKK